MRKLLSTSTCLSLSLMTGYAQSVGNANTALNNATSELKTIFNSGVNLFMVVCGIIALLGLVVAIVKWYQGDSQTAMTAGKFLAGGIFAIIGVLLIRGLFGL